MQMRDERTTTEELELERLAQQLLHPVRGAKPSPRARSGVLAALAQRGVHDGNARSGLLRLRWAAIAAAAATLPLLAGGSAMAMTGGELGPVHLPFLSRAGDPPAGDAPAGAAKGAEFDAPKGAESASEAATEGPGMAEPSVTPAAVGPGGARGASEGLGASICLAATAHAQEVLAALLASGQLDAEGIVGVERALAAIEACGSGAGEEADAGPPAGAPQGPPEGVPQGPPEGVPQGPPEGPPEGVPQGPPEGVPQGPRDGVPQGPPEGVPQGRPEGVPQGPLEGVPQGPPPANPAGSASPESALNSTLIGSAAVGARSDATTPLGLGAEGEAGLRVEVGATAVVEAGQPRWR